MEACRLSRAALAGLLARVVILGEKPSVPEECVGKLLRLADANRAGLEAARRLGVEDRSGAQRLAGVSRLLAKVVESLRGLSFAVHKLTTDPLTRSTCINLPKAIMSKHGLKTLRSKLTRETY